jgi:hypothetical protein
VVSKVSRDVTKSHGTFDPEVTVRDTTARTSVRAPVAPTRENGSVAVAICPLVTVKVVAVPMIVPAAFRNEMLPVQDAAVPLEELDAVLTAFTCAVSELPSPMGGDVNDRVEAVDVVVCAKAPIAVIAASARADKDRRNMLYLS